MTGIVAGFFSLTSGPADGDDEAYLRWHLLDHLPEQYTIPQIRLGTRWRADDACVDLRLVADPAYAPVRHVMSYLLTEPVEEGLTAFARLGAELRAAGRYGVAATPHLLGAYERIGCHAAPGTVSAEAMPFRAHRGVYLVLEQPPADPGVQEHWRAWHDGEHLPALLAVPGVAGVATYAATARLGVDPGQGERFGMLAWDPRGLAVTIVHFDGDVADAAHSVAPLLEQRWRGPDVVPVLAGPFRSTVTYEAWPEGT